ncbi:hypothetical protein PoB_002442400 [Plakobranchus ocellatus]|uniref:Sulfotransferase domain-containing protein n=1 Tax=Plakobranchus ocellatus TaxID=259542 RepID=A0AAV3ZRG7_9GAST|nr:hypothetical protein PoB_002442400 [Plakobranchus ocellatus]
MFLILRSFFSHKTPVVIVQRLAKFLGLTAGQQLCEDIVTACDFDTLKRADDNRAAPDNLNKVFDQFNVFQKVGDWKNQFTIAQSEMFDEFIARQGKSHFAFSFRWH